VRCARSGCAGVENNTSKQNKSAQRHRLAAAPAFETLAGAPWMVGVPLAGAP